MTPVTAPGPMLTVPGLFERPDYFEILARLRREAPVARTPDGLWAVTRYEDIRMISREPHRFCSGRGVLVNDPIRVHGAVNDETSLLHIDPPHHSRYRGVANRQFTPRAVGRLEERIRVITREVLEAADPRGEIDLVGEIAAPIPVRVIAELLGIDAADLATFRRWSDAVIEVIDHPTAEVYAESGELLTYLMRLADQRRSEPRDDLVSRLWQAQYQGEPLSHEQVRMFGLTLLVAGNETTRHLLSGTLAALAAHPEQRAALVREPDRIPAAVEECLRWTTPIQAFGRTATEDLTLHGQQIAAGDFLVLLYASGNRDELVFGPTADRFDVARAPGPNISFGFGEHLCLGASLARLEARVVLEELLARFPNFVTGPPIPVQSTLVRGFQTLPGVLSP
ncbi:cytochrome P450 [Pseudofrankia inefficax]|uniref:Cytochrome P450 n=1 Tax=Pseudofrankia inefficax (strain DSM 45817 / CECT 9037 / DDB 130130 / EuI1c) TaxID=298654 RepID=E3IWL3_PSEI1|nr:cytochrome P450 [Pseudofrankia inefficax]ADP81343.1 cytochrome P450 [Pseudofrankia inefficax]